MPSGDCRSVILRLAANGRALATGCMDGLVKAVADQQTDALLGVMFAVPTTLQRLPTWNMADPPKTWLVRFTHTRLYPSL